MVAALSLAGGIAALALLRRRRALDLAGRVVLITGGSRGLGLELARQFAEQGASLGLLARDPEELQAARARLAGAPVELLACDLRDQEQVERAVDRLLDRFGRLDVLVNDAGTIRVAPLANLNLEDFREEMESNFFSALHATLAALPHLRASGSGRIVNITSIGGRLPVPHLLPYTASKFALVGFSEALRAELSHQGISVTTVTPGLMRTGSPYRAMFGGRPSSEFKWFLLASSLPVLSVSARHAAKRMVAACRRGDASLVLPAYIRLPIALHGLAPGLVARLAGLADLLLPRPTSDPGLPLREGRDIESPERSGAYAALTVRAAKRNNELG
jgi:NAD(P)-dependent dehydrogenase (short-subunit alcohol dehydrogenase family)